MEVIIDVTKEDIDCGVKGDSNNCAIARAVKRKVKQKYWSGVAIGSTHMGIEHTEEVGRNLDGFLTRKIYWKHSTPSIQIPEQQMSADRWIELFDSNYATVHPFKFQVEMPDDIVYCPEKDKSDENKENKDSSITE